MVREKQKNFKVEEFLKMSGKFLDIVKVSEKWGNFVSKVKIALNCAQNPTKGRKMLKMKRNINGQWTKLKQM